MNLIALARRLGALHGHLEDSARRSGTCDYDPPLAASYLYLLGRLALVDGDEVADAVAGAVGVWDRESRRAREADEARRARADAEYSEMRRRHLFAIDVKCPYCGAPPGTMCRTRGGHARGICDHAGRWRAVSDGPGAGEVLP